MPLTLGGPAGLTFTGGDGPNDFPIQATVAGQQVALSDGARYFQDTGLTPSALTWTGTFEYNDNFGTPQQKQRYVEGLRDGRTRTTLSLEGYAWGGFVQDATLTPTGAGRVKYSITFEVEVPGTLTQAEQRAQTAGHEARVTTSLDAINTLAGGLSAATQAANAAVQSARGAVGV